MQLIGHALVKQVPNDQNLYFRYTFTFETSVEVIDLDDFLDFLDIINIFYMLYFLDVLDVLNI